MTAHFYLSVPSEEEQEEEEEEEEYDEEEDEFDDDIDDEVLSRVAEETLAAAQQPWNSASSASIGGQSNSAYSGDTSFTATQLTHNTRVSAILGILHNGGNQDLFLQFFSRVSFVPPHPPYDLRGHFWNAEI